MAIDIPWVIYLSHFMSGIVESCFILTFDWKIQGLPKSKNRRKGIRKLWIALYLITRGRGTGEASEATASPEFRGFTTEKFLTSWIYEEGSYSCFIGKKLVPRPLSMYIYFYVRALIMIGYLKLAKTGFLVPTLSNSKQSWKCVRRQYKIFLKKF